MKEEKPEGEEKRPSDVEETGELGITRPVGLRLPFVPAEPPFPSLPCPLCVPRG